MYPSRSPLIVYNEGLLQFRGTTRPHSLRFDSFGPQFLGVPNLPRVSMLGGVGVCSLGLGLGVCGFFP